MQDTRRGRWPKVSVVMSTYDRAELLGEAVRSVLNQDFDDFELIVVEDGSDVARGVLEQMNEDFAAKGVRVLLLRLEKNSGYQAKPKNVGIAHARGSYIAHADDDDIWYKDHLSTLVGEIEKGGAELVYGTWDFGGEREGTFEFIPLNGITANLILSSPLTNFISCHTLYSKSAMVARVGPKVFSEDLRRFGDWDVYRRFLEAGGRIRGVNKPTFIYRWHGKNLQLTRPPDEGTTKAVQGGEVPWDGKVL